MPGSLDDLFADVWAGGRRASSLARLRPSACRLSRRSASSIRVPWQRTWSMGSGTFQVMALSSGKLPPPVPSSVGVMVANRGLPPLPGFPASSACVLKQHRSGSREVLTVDPTLLIPSFLTICRRRRGVSQVPPGGRGRDIPAGREALSAGVAAANRAWPGMHRVPCHGRESWRTARSPPEVLCPPSLVPFRKGRSGHQMFPP